MTAMYRFADYTNGNATHVMPEGCDNVIALHDDAANMEEGDVHVAVDLLRGTVDVYHVDSIRSVGPVRGIDMDVVSVGHQRLTLATGHLSGIRTTRYDGTDAAHEDILANGAAWVATMDGMDVDMLLDRLSRSLRNGKSC